MPNLHPTTRCSARRNTSGPRRSRAPTAPGSEPVPAPPRQAATAPATAAGLHAHLRVLIVDDDPVNLLVAAGMLTALGLRPVVAADGAEAVVQAGRQRLDLILMDLQMPVLDGLAATSAIRQDERATARPRVPVVAFTSFGGDGRGLGVHGVDALLQKPCTLDELQRCVQQWCPPR
jgi:CheY-like chemotaxis protein